MSNLGQPPNADLSAEPDSARSDNAAVATLLDADYRCGAAEEESESGTGYSKRSFGNRRSKTEYGNDKQSEFRNESKFPSCHKLALDVSVCIASWNCQDLLRNCLWSLQHNSPGVNLEIIVVDNASTDGAAEMVAREFPEVLLIRNSANRGFARANNQAALQARGRFLFFLNNDTVVPAGTLARLVAFARRNPDIGMVGPRLRDGSGKYQVSYRQRPTLAALLHKTSLLRWTGLFQRAYRHYRRENFDPNTVRQVDVLMGAAILLRRDFFFQCGGWDEHFTFGGEDIELSTRVNRMAKVVYWPLAEVLHYGRVSSRMHAGFASSQMAIGLVQYLRKTGYGCVTILAYKMLITLDAPVQWLEKMLQGSWRRLRGRRVEAQRSWLAAHGAAHFLTRSLPAFWRA